MQDVQRITDLTALEIAINEQNVAEVRKIFEEADIASGNDQMLAASKEYGFQIYALNTPPFNGRCFMLGRDLARIMYGKQDTSGVGALLRSYSLDFIPIGALVDDLRRLIVEHFGLSKFNSNTVFATWDHFLLVGMYGQTPYARRVKAYIRKMEKAHRVSEKVEESTGMSPRQIMRATLQSSPPPGQKLLAAKDVEEEITLCMAFRVPDHIAATRAKELAERRYGIDLSEYLNNSELMLNVPAEAHFCTITDLTKEFGLRTGVLNKVLEGLHFQVMQGRWFVPTTQALDLGVCRARAEEMHGKKLVHYIEWKRSFIADRVIPWINKHRANE